MSSTYKIDERQLPEIVTKNVSPAKKNESPAANFQKRQEAHKFGDEEQFSQVS